MRIHRLDGLRGIAASAVLLQHGMETIGFASSDLNARPAVLFFFVLSGFVLALPYVDGRQVQWPTFLLRRFLRLWPPVAAVVGLAAIMQIIVMPAPPYLGIWWSQPVSEDLIARCLLLSVQEGGCGTLVLPLWSLAYEARASALFPLLMLLVLRDTRATLLAAIAIGLGVEVQALVQGRFASPIYAHDLIGDIVLTLHFTTLFVFGAVLAVHRTMVAQRIAASGIVQRVALIATAILLMLIPSDLVRGVAGVLIIALALSARSRASLLDSPPARWLGRISFSLYLVHQPVLATFVYMNGGPLSLVQMLVASGVALIAAEAMFRFIELPTMALARGVRAPRALSNTHHAVTPGR